MIHIQGRRERARHFIHLLRQDCIIYFRNFSFNIFGLQLKPGIIGDPCISNSLLLGLCPLLPQGNISQSWPPKNSVLLGFLWHSGFSQYFAISFPSFAKCSLNSFPLQKLRFPKSAPTPLTHSLLECFTLLPITILLCLRRFWASCPEILYF